MSALIVAQELSRWYGMVMGLNNVSFEIAPGLTGLVGPNGAGKSTQNQIITGHLNPSSGSIDRLRPGALEQSSLLLRRIGFCPGRRGGAEGIAPAGVAARVGPDVGHFRA